MTPPISTSRKPGRQRSGIVCRQDKDYLLENRLSPIARKPRPGRDIDELVTACAVRDKSAGRAM